MRIARILVPLIALLMFAPLGGWSADERVANVSVCVFPLANLSPNGAQQEHQKPLSEAVRQEFENAGFHVLPDDQWTPQAESFGIEPNQVTGGTQAIFLGNEIGFDMAVTGSYWIENDRILVSIQCWDIKAGTLITGFLHTWRFNLGFYNFVRAEIADLAQRVVFLSAPRLIALKNDVRVDEIIFTSTQEGMEVLIQGHKSIGRIQNGTLVFQTDGINAGTTFTVEKRQEGYHTLQQTVVAAPQVELTPIPRANNLSLEADWTFGQLEGAGATLRWYPKPDWIMISFSEYLYAQISLLPNASVPIHADSELLAGLYLFRPPEAGFRFGLSAGVGTILTWIPATSLPLFTDVYINILSLWAEWKAWGIPMFVRVETKLPLGIGNNLLGSGGPPLLWGGFFPPITLGVVIPWK